MSNVICNLKELIDLHRNGTVILQQFGCQDILSGASNEDALHPISELSYAVEFLFFLLNHSNLCHCHICSIWYPIHVAKHTIHVAKHILSRQVNARSTRLHYQWSMTRRSTYMWTPAIVPSILFLFGCAIWHQVLSRLLSFLSLHSTETMHLQGKATHPQFSLFCLIFYVTLAKWANAPVKIWNYLIRPVRPALRILFDFENIYISFFFVLIENEVIS